MTEPNAIDWVAAIVKGTVGAVPLVGPIVAELVGNLIPQQRVDRIVTFMQELDRRLRDAQQTQERIRSRLEDPRVLDLLEDGLHQAARAVSEERKQHIASIVADGLSSENVDFLESKHLLSILNELNDVEVLVLASYSFQFQKQEGHSGEWRQVTSFERPTLASPQQVVDRYAIQQSYRNHLMRLGLLKYRFLRPSMGFKRSSAPELSEVPQFDYETGMVKSEGIELTPLGGLLLRKVGLVNEALPKEKQEECDS